MSTKNYNKPNYNAVLLKEDALRIVSLKGVDLKYLNDNFKDDVDVVLMAMKQNITSFVHASSRIRNDKVFFKSLIDSAIHSPSVLQFAGGIIKDDKESVMGWIKKGHTAFKFASDRLKNDFDVAFLAIDLYAMSIQLVSKELQDNDVIFQKALLKDYHAYKYGSSRLKENIEMLYSLYDDSISNFYQLNKTNLISNEVKIRFQSHLLKIETPETLLNTFIKLNDKLKFYKSKKKFSSIVTFDSIFKDPMEHILSRMDAKTLSELSTSHQEFKNLIARAKIINVSLELKPINKTRKIGF